jgi:uncharacterized RDD family membrane protein YckC
MDKASGFLEKSELKIAGVQDRVLSFFLDVLLFSPFLSFLLTPLHGSMRNERLDSNSTLEFVVFVFLALLESALLIILLQSWFLYRFGATPGMRYFKLKLVALNSQRLSFSQCLVRSSIWILQWIPMGAPFLEVLSHPQRRGLHDRASETMVVTLKEVGDPGPTEQGRDLIKNVISLSVCLTLGWSSLVGYKLFRQASNGDFSRKSLESSQYLCPEVGEYLKPGGSRMDLALALYLTDEQDESCLLREADFALWTRNTTEKSWAYLAKGIYYEFDQKKSLEYLQKACAAGSGSEPCQLAQRLIPKDKGFDPLLRGHSWTAEFLKVKEFLRRGQFQLAQDSLREYDKEPAFAEYIQKQQVKLFWTLQEPEKAQGAYQVVWPHLSADTRLELAAWMCAEQVDKDCGRSAHTACANLQDEVRSSDQISFESDVVLALVNDNECTKAHRPLLQGLAPSLSENSELKKFVYALSSESGWSPEHRLAALRELSFSGKIKGHLQKKAMASLAKISTDSLDRKRIKEFLADAQIHDWMWSKLGKVLNPKAPMELRLPASDLESEHP